MLANLPGFLLVLASITNQLTWEIPGVDVRLAVQPGGAIVGTPLVTDSGIYFDTEDGSLVSVNADGTIRWNQPFEGNSLHAGPVLAGDFILISTSNPENILVAIDSNGVQKWSYSLDQ